MSQKQNLITKIILYAFQFYEESHAIMAVEELDGVIFKGNKLTIKVWVYEYITVATTEAVSVGSNFNSQLSLSTRKEKHTSYDKEKITTRISSYSDIVEHSDLPLCQNGMKITLFWYHRFVQIYVGQSYLPLRQSCLLKGLN